MSETYRNNTEVSGEHSIEKHEDHEKLEAQHSGAEKHKAEISQAEKLLAAREEADRESAEKDKLLDKLKVEQEPEEDKSAPRLIDDNLKKSTFQKEIGHVRKRLSKVDRFGSRLIHQPVIRSASEISSRTITRPSGLLGGGITAFLGTSIYLYLTKYIGLKYNYSIFLFLLVAGFVVGLILEAAIRLTKGRRSV